MSGLNSDLSLDSLTDDLSINVEDLGSPQKTTSSLEQPLDGSSQNIGNQNTLENTTSEEGTPESVAGKEGDDKTPEVSSSSSPGNLSQIYSSFATSLVDKGVLSNLNLEETKVESLDDLQEAIQNQINSSVGDLEREYMEAMKGGVDKDAFVSYQRTKNQLDNINEDVLRSEDERALSLRRNIIGQDFLNRGFTKEEAIEYANRSVDLGRDVNDAVQALAKLKAHNEETFAQHKRDEAKKTEETHNDIRKYIDSTSEIFKGLKLSKAIKDRLYNQIINPVGTGKTGAPVNQYAAEYEKDPVKFQVMQNYLYMVTKGFTDFSKLSNIATTKVSREMDELLKGSAPNFFENSAGSNIGLQDSNSTFNIGDGLSIDI